LKISIVIPTFNRAALLPRALRSALANAGPGDEIIVVDDGSTDNTTSVVGGFGEPVRFLRLNHQGAGAARNAGVKAARNPLVAFLDSDDEWMPDKLAIQRHFMENRPDILFTGTNFCVRKLEEEISGYAGKWLCQGKSFKEMFGAPVPYSSICGASPRGNDFDVYIGRCYASLLATNCISTITLMVRRQEAGDALHFAEDIPTFEDWECIARLARAGRFAFLDCDTAWNYGHDGPRLTDANDFETATSRLRLIQRVWGADDSFLQEHGSCYDAMVRTQRLVRTRYFLRSGNSKEARAELGRLDAAPLEYRMMAGMPGPLLKALHAVRSAVKKGANTTR